MIQITIYKPDGTKVYQNPSAVKVESGVLSFDWRKKPSDDAYTSITTSCPFFIEETFGK